MDSLLLRSTKVFVLGPQPRLMLAFPSTQQVLDQGTPILHFGQIFLKENPIKSEKLGFEGCVGKKHWIRLCTTDIVFLFIGSRHPLKVKTKRELIFELMIIFHIVNIANTII